MLGSLNAASHALWRARNRGNVHGPQMNPFADVVV
jgi:hypothetical protein